MLDLKILLKFVILLQSPSVSHREFHNYYIMFVFFLFFLFFIKIFLIPI